MSIIGTLLSRGLQGGATFGAGAIGSMLYDERSRLLRSYYGDQTFEDRFGSAPDVLSSGVYGAGVVGGIAAGIFGYGGLARGAMGAAKLGAGAVSGSTNMARRGLANRAVARSEQILATRQAEYRYYQGRQETLSQMAESGVDGLRRPKYNIARQRMAAYHRLGDAEGRLSIAQMRRQSMGGGPDLSRGMGVLRGTVGGMARLSPYGVPIAAGAYIGANTPHPSSVPAEGRITNFGKNTVTKRLNFSTAGLVQGLHSARRTV